MDWGALIIGICPFAGGALHFIDATWREAEIQRHMVDNSESDWKPSTGRGVATFLATLNGFALVGAGAVALYRAFT